MFFIDIFNGKVIVKMGDESICAPYNNSYFKSDNFTIEDVVIKGQYVKFCNFQKVTDDSWNITIGYCVNNCITSFKTTTISDEDYVLELATFKQDLKLDTESQERKVRQEMFKQLFRKTA